MALLNYRYFVCALCCSIGNGLDFASALQFWRAALAEADKVVNEHAKALRAAEKPGYARDVFGGCSRALCAFSVCLHVFLSV